MFKKIKGFWDLTRLSLGILAGISAIEGALLTSLLLEEQRRDVFQDVMEHALLFVLGFLIPMAIVSAAMALNDYYDYPIDLKNNRLDRPLVRGDLSPHTAKYLALALDVFGIMASLLFLNLIMTALVLVFVLLSIFYSYQSATGTHALNLKRRGMIGNIVVSSSYLAPFVLGSLFWLIYKQLTPTNTWLLTLSLFVVGTLVGTLGREILKGLLDIQGDAAHDIKTIAVTWGDTGAKILGISLMTTGLVIFYILVLQLFSTPMALGASLLFLLFATIAWFKTIDIVLRSGKTQNYRGLRGITRAALWFITLALLVGVMLQAISV